MYDEGIAERDGKLLNIQCMISQAAKRTDIHFHYHRYIELIYVTKGNIRAYIGNNVHTAGKNQLIIVYPGEPHTYTSDEKNEHIVLKFMPDVLFSADRSANEFEYMFNFNRIKLDGKRVIQDTYGFKRLASDALKIFLENKYGYEILLRADLVKIYGMIIKYWKDTNEITPIESKISREKLAMIENIVKVVKDTNGDIKTHEAAQKCYLSDGHFSRIFSSVMNMSFTSYVKSVKIAEAERLLKCTDTSINDIAQNLNYATASHFIEDFKKIKGISPRKYRFSVYNQKI